MTQIAADASLSAPEIREGAGGRRTSARSGGLFALRRRWLPHQHPARGRARRAAPAVDPREFDAALVALFARGRRSSAPLTSALSLVFALVAASLIAPAAALAWLCAAAAAQLLAFAVASGGVETPPRRARRERMALVLTEALVGASFALLVALLARSGEPAALCCAAIMALIACAARAAVSQSIPLAVVAGAAPSALVVAVLLARTQAADGASQALALALGAQLCVLALAARLHRGAVESLAMQSEKDELIAELEQAKADSDMARRRAEAANLAKSHFLATMSHELRTPLNAILGFSEVMKGELFGAHLVASYKEYSHDIHESGHHLLTLINEILDLSRIEAGRFDLKETPVALGHIVEDCRHLLALRARKRAVSIGETVEPGLPRLRADERAVRQMALNLLSNAVKFTPPGGRVDIRVGWTASGGQYFSVRDTGPGIPADELPTVMAAFGRGALARKNAEEGSGLGLPIVKGLAELHGGRFLLRSAPGEGVEAVVIFPARRVLEAGGEAQEDLDAARRRRRARRDVKSAA